MLTSVDHNMIYQNRCKSLKFANVQCKDVSKLDRYILYRLPELPDVGKTVETESISFVFNKRFAAIKNQKKRPEK